MFCLLVKPLTKLTYELFKKNNLTQVGVLCLHITKNIAKYQLGTLLIAACCKKKTYFVPLSLAEPMKNGKRITMFDSHKIVFLNTQASSEMVSVG